MKAASVGREDRKTHKGCEGEKKVRKEGRKIDIGWGSKGRK